jgi:hypothetical protein
MQDSGRDRGEVVSRKWVGGVLALAERGTDSSDTAVYIILFHIVIVIMCQEESVDVVDKTLLQTDCCFEVGGERATFHH